MYPLQVIVLEITPFWESCPVSVKCPRTEQAVPQKWINHNTEWWPRLRENISPWVFCTHAMDEEELRGTKWLLLPAFGFCLCRAGVSHSLDHWKNGHFCTHGWCWDNCIHLLISSLLAYGGAGKKQWESFFVGVLLANAEEILSEFWYPIFKISD